MHAQAQGCDHPQLLPVACRRPPGQHMLRGVSPLPQVSAALSGRRDRRHLTDAEASGRELLAAGFKCPRKGKIAADGKCSK